MPSSKRTKSPAPAKRDKSPAPAKTSATHNKLTGVKATYKTTFDKIDTDGSGFIDSAELYNAIIKLFPALHITGAEVKSMMDEADVNHDGVLSLDEFSHILSLTEGKSNLWGKTQSSFWASALKNIGDINTAFTSSTKPLREFGQDHSYHCSKSGSRVATVGLRSAAVVLEAIITYSILIVFSVSYAAQAVSKWTESNRPTKSAFVRELQYDFINGGAADVINTMMIVVSLLFAGYGKKLGMFFFGMTVVDEKTGQPATIIQFLCFDILYFVISGIHVYQLLQLKTLSHYAIKAQQEKFQSIYLVLSLVGLVLNLGMVFTGKYWTEYLLGLQVTTASK